MRQLTWCLRQKLFDALTSWVSEMSLRDSGDDLMAFAAPGVSRGGSEGGLLPAKRASGMDGHASPYEDTGNGTSRTAVVGSI